jgi:hypothetical protein
VIVINDESYRALAIISTNDLPSVVALIFTWKLGHPVRNYFDHTKESNSMRSEMLFDFVVPFDIFSVIWTPFDNPPL